MALMTVDPLKSSMCNCSHSFLFFNSGGVNLIVDIPAKAKKPTLYATALMSHSFTNEEMRQGSLEPKESKGKKALDPTKISLIESEYPMHNVLLKFILCLRSYFMINTIILCCFTNVMPEINLTMRIACPFIECIRAKFGGCLVRWVAAFLMDRT